MKRLAAAVCLTLVCAPLSAAPVIDTDEATFVSLTRRPSTSSRLASNVSVVTAEDIERSGAANLADVLESLPSVDLLRSGGLGTFASVRLRGVPSSNQTQIVIDDQPLGGVSIQDIDVSRFPVEDIERIEIVRGGSSVLYGANTIGGVIHIITKRHTEPGTSAEIGLEARSYQTRIGRLSAGSNVGQVDAKVTAQALRSDGYLHNSEIDSHSGSANAGYSFANGARLAADFSVIDQENGSPNGTSVPFDQWDGERERTPNSLTQHIENRFQRVRLTGSGRVGPVFVRSVTYHSNEYYKLLLNKTTPSAPLARNHNQIAGNDTRFLFDGGLTLGASYERDERTAQAQASRHITNWGLYAQEQVQAGRLQILPGLRFDQHSTFGNVLNPRLSLILRASDRWTVSANAARSYRAPKLVDLYIVSRDPFFPEFDFVGNPNLDPERAWTYDLGQSYRLGERTQFAMTGFLTQIEDRITAVDTDGNGNNDTLANTSRAEILGAEAQLTLGHRWFTHGFNYTYQRARGTSVGSSGFVPLRLTPRHLANYELTFEPGGGFQVNNQVRYISRQYQNDGEQGVKLPSYTVWDVRVRQRIGGATLFAGVDNVTGKRYAESVTFGVPVPMPDRTWVAGASVRFP